MEAGFGAGCDANALFMGFSHKGRSLVRKTSMSKSECCSKKLKETTKQLILKMCVFSVLYFHTQPFSRLYLVRIEHDGKSEYEYFFYGCCLLYQISTELFHFTLHPNWTPNKEANNQSLPFIPMRTS